jgi:propanol-preferring alcohol dehydrogenase
MRAAILRSPGPVEGTPLQVEDVDPPEAGPGEVLLDVTACGVCRTDLQICEGDLVARRLPIVPGHQIVGRVRALGTAVDGIATGARVGVAWLASACGVCAFCTSGRENLCTDAAFTGWDRDGATPHGHRRPSLRPPPRATTSRSHRCSAAGSSAGGASHGQSAPGLRAVRLRRVCVARRQLATYLGCECYVATRSTTEQDRARALGARRATTPTHRRCPLGAAITFAPVGSGGGALRAVDRGGTVVVNAIHLDHIPEFDYGLLWWERSIRSVANVTRDDVRSFLEVAQRVPVVTSFDTYDLADANRALASVKDGTVHGAAVLVP